MPAHFLIRHWKKELQVFYKNLLLLQKAPNTEAVHDLRVAIKKLRSYTRFYSVSFKKDGAALFPVNVINLFSVLGRQRNIEMSLELLQKFSTGQFISLKKYFESYLNETKQRSCLALQQFNGDDLKLLTIEIEKTISSVDEEPTKQDLRKLIKVSVAEMRRYLKNFSKNYHLVRKKLKDIFYWAHILPGETYFSKQAMKDIKKILDDLGQVQDQEVFRTGLRHYRRTVVAKNTEEYVEIKKVENTVRQKTERLLKEALEMTKELLSKKAT